MSYFPDLSPYSLWSSPPDLLNIGWLDESHPFPTGSLSTMFLERLAWLCVNSTANQTRGVHICELCPPVEDGVHWLEYRGNKYLLGTAEIHTGIPAPRYSAPTLIIHYVASHSYKPPQEYIDSVNALPNILPASGWRIGRGPYW